MRGGNFPRLFLLTALILLSFSSAKAIGIAPATADLILEDNSTYKLTFYVYNSEKETIIAQTHATGELAQYVFIDEDELTIAPGELAPFHAYISLPEELPAGTYTLYIGASGKISEVEGISAEAYVDSEVTVTKLYGQSELRLEVNANNVPAPGKPAKIILLISNPSSKDIDAFGEVKITDVFNKQVSYIPIDSIHVSAQSSLQISESWDTEEVLPGIYTLTAIVNYGAELATNSTQIQVGKPRVSLLNVTVAQKKESAQFISEVQNDWNGLLNGVKATVEVMEDGEVISSGSSEEIDLSAGQRTSLIAEVNTTYNPNKQTAKVTVFFNGMSTSKIIGKRAKESVNMFYIVVAILIAIIAVMAFFYLRRPKIHNYVYRW